VALGYHSGLSVSTGTQNTIIGGAAGDALTTGANNIIIGYNAAASAVGVNNEITLGDANIAAFRCADDSISTLSDRRDKSNIKDSEFGLDFINSIRPVEFTWDYRPEHMAEAKQGKTRVGFIAQELQEAMPNGENEILDLVYDIDENRIEAKYSKLVPILTKAIQELSAKVKMLENK
jgi:trimeric autotransporter adhesin